MCVSQKDLLAQCCSEVNAGRSETLALIEVVEQLSKQVAILSADHQQPQPRSRVKVEAQAPEPYMPAAPQPLECRQSFLLVSKPQVAAQLQAVEQSVIELKAAVADQAKPVPTPKHKNYLQKSLQKRSAWQLA